MEYLAEKDVWCVKTPMPMTVHGFCCRKAGVIYMFINSQLSPKAEEEAIEHEFEHIDNGDLYSEEEAAEIERKLK